MFILDESSDKYLKKIILYLTIDEIKELKDSIESLIAKPENTHMHISDESYKKEITFCIYSPSNIKDFNERSKRILTTDE